MNNIPVQNQPAQINRLKIDPYHFVYKKISSNDKSKGLNKYDLNLYSYSTAIRAKGNVLLIRGRVEIKRFFKDDRFYISFIFATPDYSKYSNLDEYSFRNLLISVNNKPLDNKKISFRETIYNLKDDNSKELDSLFNYEKSSFKAKPKDNIKICNVIISSDLLGLKFSELNSITVQNTGINKEIWDIKKQKNNVAEYFTEAKNNFAGIDIAEKYQFDFGELDGDILGTKTEYLHTDLEFSNFRNKRITNFAKEKIQSDKNIAWKQKDKFGYKFKNFDDYRLIMDMNQSLSTYGITDIDSDLCNHITKKQISSKIYESIYSTGTQKSEYTFDNPITFDYKLGCIVDSKSFSDVGLFIPYNFKGQLNTIYKYIFDNGGLDKKSDFITVNISQKQEVVERLLDVNDGLIKLEITNSKTLIGEPQYKFNSKDIEEIIKQNDINISIFEQYKDLNE
ncbi:hypothetical protein KQ874_02260 [Mycoplasma sp. ES3157-GEN-MYC]|uniref:Uncharacterized protein n=1 Tax=Mycoplasma miroungigenitalium TaxID=754515 RepID=A0A6M4JEU8_9MOLU|nr:hypothetical protein [Mycoplasma miroungigenitalium]MBU4690508.1 hypothetical protein [Mycoplasma miroungigenitalium]MBU4691775.1 hypothetical protein [Mycoplasma miroungigenitalium]QJR43602.1 hypothetical protein HLA87_02265 [Mycoplasma miroungigenitalium]